MRKGQDTPHNWRELIVGKDRS